MDAIKKEKAYDNLQNEGGEGYNPYRQAAADARIDRQIAERNAKLIAQGWTVEGTIARRQEWNDAVRAGKIKKATDTINGWGASDLKNAMAMHGIK